MYVLFVLVSSILFHLSSTSKLTQLGDSSYYVSNAEAGYLEAEFICKASSLEFIRFETEDEFIVFNNTMDSWGLNNNAEYWLGAISFENGLWYWSATQKRINYSNWDSNEPSCHEATGCCLDMNYKTGLSRKWTAVSCCDLRLYICESRS